MLKEKKNLIKIIKESNDLKKQEIRCRDNVVIKTSESNKKQKNNLY